MKLILNIGFVFILTTSFAQESNMIYFDSSCFKRINYLLVRDTGIGKPPNRLKPTFSVENDLSVYNSLSSILEVANEPPYFNNPQIVESYRLTLIRSFKKVIVITFSSENNTALLVTKWLTKAKGVENYKSVHLSNNDIVDFRTLLNNSQFWSSTQSCISDAIYIDGTRWLLEAKCNNKYHFIFRRLSDLELAAKNIGDWLIEKSEAKNELGKF